MRTEVKAGLIVGLLVISGFVLYAVNQGGSGQQTGSIPFDIKLDSVDGAGDEPPLVAEIDDEPPAEPARTFTPGGLEDRSPARAQRARRDADGETPPSGGVQRDVTAGRQARAPAGQERVAEPTSGRRLQPVIGEPREGRGEDIEPPDAKTDRLTGRVTSPVDVATPLNAPTLTSLDDEPRRSSKQPTTQPAQRRGAEEPPVVVPAPTAKREPTDPSAAVRNARRTLPKATRYTVERGDTLIGIARAHYGEARYWTKVRDANPGLEPTNMKVGQVILLPPKEILDEGGSVPTTRLEPGGQRVDRATYVVEHGDTLTSIARNLLGDGSRWREIYELNRDTIDNPNVVTPGTELKLPPVERKRIDNP